MKDKSGREVQAGDLIVYGHAMGRASGLRYGKVLEIDAKGRVKVQGVDTDWYADKAKLCKPGLLYFGERLLVVTVEQVPLKVLQRLAAC